jgi:glutamyl-tRNA reductase
VIILCAESDEPILKKSMLQDAGKKLILDLSVPSTTEPGIAELNDTVLLTIDDISLLLNNTLQNRMEFLPLAENIIQHAMKEFAVWHKTFVHKDKISHVKSRLMEISSACPYLSKLEKPQLARIMNKAMAELVHKIKNQNFSSDDIDQTISYFLKLNHQLVETNN